VEKHEYAKISFFFFHLKVNYIKFSSFNKLIKDFPNIGQVLEMATKPPAFPDSLLVSAQRKLISGHR
jgi:hypothetical protein